ncbi:MAG: RNA polymerase sigma factor [Acidobacteria bacterium]|nr:RNA polymerase sigma factor [Acidobacteriota bacterium]
MDEALAHRDPAGTGPVEDIGLVKRLLAGEEQAYLDLVRSLHGGLLRFAMSFVSDRSVAEEVVQETWLGVLNGLAAFEGRSSLKTWIYRILMNRARTRAVREARVISFASLAGSESENEPAVEPERFAASGRWTDPPHSWSLDTPETILLRAETHDFLKKAIEELLPKQRAVIVLRDIEGMNPEDVCNILEISETNQRVLLHRARSRVRKLLEQHLSV